jgi:hypothetical protein
MRHEGEDEMDMVIVIAYGVVAAAAIAGGIVLARVIWLKLGHREPVAPVQRAEHDRRRRTAPVMWDRRVRARRLEDVAKGFLGGFDKGMGAGAQ